jgi:signal transduction histidine kinase
MLENENELKRQQVRNQRLFAAVLSVAVLLLVVFIFFMFRLRAIQQRANRELMAQKIEIQTQAENLEELNKLKTKLFSVISHDLRGPISNIKVLFGMIANKSMTQEEFMTLSVKLKSTVDNTHRTLENLLNWCLSQMGGIVTETQQVELTKAIDEACKLLEDMATSKKIAINKDIVEGSTVLADANQLQLILRNLIHNAIKFSNPATSVKITTEQKGEHWKITLHDSGTGMSEADITTLLNTQNNFSKYGTNQEKGTGLGLMLCKEFITRNKGKLEIESAFNQGTAISFYLPKAN